MPKTRVHCTIVEVGCDDATADGMKPGNRLLPWADPFITQLVANYRLRAALDDSLDFLRSEASQHHYADAPEPMPFGARSPRFSMPPASSQPDAGSWPE